MPPPILNPTQFQVTLAEPVSSLLPRHLGISTERALELMAFGAVYWNCERLRVDRVCEAGDWLRVHREPRRFPIDGIDWKQRIVWDEPEFLIVDKPAGVPIHPTADNEVENVIRQLERTLSIPLWIGHRLDIPTCGLVALAKSREACTRFQQWLEARRVKKRYRALVERDLPAGEVIHYMAPLEGGPRHVEKTAHDGWKRCHLHVDACRNAGKSYEVEITLGTGRHHQIRAQLAALGAPIVGDTLYGSRAGLDGSSGGREAIALQSFELEFEGRSCRLEAPWAASDQRG